MENKTKLRLLYLYRYLVKNTDPEHPISTPELIEILKTRYGIDANRNTLTNDFQMLEQAGYSFEVIHSQQNKYYYDGRTFDQAELKLLIDAVSSSKFITQKKSREMVEKILSLTTKFRADKLRRHVHVEGRVKSDNEKGYKILDIVNEAIDAGCKIRFQYTDYSTKKRKMLRHGGAYYVVSPYELVWDGDFYYVIGYSEDRGIIQNFRLDRFYREPELLSKDPIVPVPAGFRLSNYSQGIFRMFGTETPVHVELLCKNYIMNSVIDHFGTKIRVKEVDEEHFRIEPLVCASPTFYRWVFGWNGDMKILGPASVREEYTAMVRRALEVCELQESAGE